MIPTFSPREIDVLEAVRRGETIAQTAQALGIAEGNIEIIRRHIVDKISWVDPGIIGTSHSILRFLAAHPDFVPVPSPNYLARPRKVAQSTPDYTRRAGRTQQEATR